MHYIISVCYLTFTAILICNNHLILRSFRMSITLVEEHFAFVTIVELLRTWVTTRRSYRCIRRVNHREIANFGASTIVCSRRTDARGRVWPACRCNSNKTATSRNSCNGHRVVMCALVDNQEKGRRAWPRPPCSCRIFWRRFSPPRSGIGFTSYSFASWKWAVGDEERSAILRPP